MGKTSPKFEKAACQFPQSNTKLVAPKISLVSLPHTAPPPQFFSGAAALCEDQ